MLQIRPHAPNSQDPFKRGYTRKDLFFVHYRELTTLFKDMHLTCQRMNPTVDAGLPKLTWDSKHHKLERIEALEEKVNILLQASEAQDEALRDADTALSLQTENVKKFLMQELKELDTSLSALARQVKYVTLWTDQFQSKFPQFRFEPMDPYPPRIIEPASTTRKPRRRRAR